MTRYRLLTDGLRKKRGRKRYRSNFNRQTVSDHLVSQKNHFQEHRRFTALQLNHEKRFRIKWGPLHRSSFLLWPNQPVTVKSNWNVQCKNHTTWVIRFLPARRYASAVFATATCPSVCPSVTRGIVRKRCILDTQLLWDGNRKPYASYRMVSLSMTLSDPWPGFQGHGSFTRRVSPKRRILQTQLLYRTLIGNHRQVIDRS